MRVLIIILILTIISGSLSAQTLYPFQVLYAENAKLSDGKELKSLDMVSVNETITLNDEGYLALVHDTGFPIEINGDTLIVMSELHSIIQGSYSRKKRKKWVEMPRFDRGIGLNYLLIKDRVNPTTRACHDCGSTIEITYPPFSSAYVLFSEDLCIKLRPPDSYTYSIKAKTLYDDILKEFTVDENQINISADEMKSLMETEKGILFEITGKATFSSGIIFPTTILIKKFVNTKLSFPYSCELKSSAAPLMVAYSFETSRYGNPKNAEEYYILATKLSSKKFYQDMLANYYRRQAK